MKLIFFSKLYPRLLREEYLRLSRNGLAAAADAHQYALALGFNAVCDNFEIVNIPALFPFPTRYKRLFEKEEVIEENGLRIQNLGSCNLIFLQNRSRSCSARRRLEQIVKTAGGEQLCIVVYSTSLDFLSSAVEIKKRHGNVKLCMIIPDIPEDMRNRSLAGRLSEKVNHLGFSSFEEYCRQMDAFVFLSKYMAERIPGCEGKYMVSEGVYDETGVKRVLKDKADSDVFTILYSGMLYRKFGVMNLVEAVRGMSDPDVRLHLYGAGDAVGEIKTIAESDSRIVYRGVADRDVVLQKQSEASLLVNPRIPDDNPFTRYSFPSKTLEYLTSGTPALIYKLDGIPDEYFEYCYHLSREHTDVESLRCEIARIKALPSADRVELSLKARKFVLENKNAESMCRAIYEFLQNLP